VNDKKDAVDALDAVVSLARQVLDKALAAQAAINQIIASTPPAEGKDQ
jgi:hypothetical protein